ncbi:alpha-tocopherol transfer protein-like [Trichoplusia ni]|uniref:Alpha-tocopherol transfer protein-like n=1 Tax=Trichoplusia ni TaxID=7111 RepID=A0A7E5WBP6_TRINI|nr:alpha-tocopherol transfer protein-like [Trichoplusia ni]
MSVSVRPLTPALEEKARKELFEDPNRLPSDLQSIKDWLAKQPHLRARTDDQWLVAFLRGCKYSLERTKEKLDLYYSVRTTAPELYRIKYTDPLFEEMLSLGVFVIIPTAPGPDAPIVSVIRPGKYDPNKYNITDIFAVTNTLMKILLVDNDNAIVAGGRSILDLEGVTMAHFLQMTSSTMKKMVVLGQDASPLRMKGTHYLNTPPGFETIFNAMKALLNEKNKNRLFVHNKNYDELYKHIPQEALPAEYGGKAGTMDEITDYWRSKVKEYSSWLDEDIKYGTDESKRPGKPKTAEDMFGVEGSFRQLEFD